MTLNLVLGLGVVVLWLRFRRPPQEDPRLSRGLQLLQSKISVLEDLSDRTDRQTQQLNALVEQKLRQLQTKMFEADQHCDRIRASMEKSQQVAEIFQDRIPHEEIVERKNTLRYVEAARMAHQGASTEDILAKVDLPPEQVELIQKFNCRDLMFEEKALPAWAQNEVQAESKAEVPDTAVMTSQPAKMPSPSPALRRYQFPTLK